MRNSGIDLSGLKKEIQERKTQKGVISESGKVVKDQFLNELVSSVRSGHETPAVNKIKEVENKAIEIKNRKRGTKEKPVFNVRKQQFNEDVHHNQPNYDNYNENEREEQLFREFQQSSKKGLADEIESFSGGGNRQPNPQVNYNMGGNSQYINEGALVNAIGNTIDKYMNENYGLVIEDSIKNVMLEAYAVDRIKQVLEENKSMIKTIVVEVIRELQERKRKSA